MTTHHWITMHAYVALFYSLLEIWISQIFSLFLEVWEQINTKYGA